MQSAQSVGIGEWVVLVRGSLYTSSCHSFLAGMVYVLRSPVTIVTSVTYPGISSLPVSDVMVSVVISKVDQGYRTEVLL